MPRRAGDWLKQAVRDLEHARLAAERGFHECSCFSAQQAAERAVRAFHQALGLEAWGHSTWQLLDSLPAEQRPGPGLIDLARELDRFYMLTRYPNMHPSGPLSVLHQE